MQPTKIGEDGSGCFFTTATVKKLISMKIWGFDPNFVGNKGRRLSSMCRTRWNISFGERSFLVRIFCTRPPRCLFPHYDKPPFHPLVHWSIGPSGSTSIWSASSSKLTSIFSVKRWFCKCVLSRHGSKEAEWQVSDIHLNLETKNPPKKMKSWAPHPSSCSCLGDEGRSFPAMSWPFGTRIRVFLGLQGFSPVIEANLREDSSGPPPGNVESHVYRDISFHQLISNRGHGHYIDANPRDALIKGKSSLLKIGHLMTLHSKTYQIRPTARPTAGLWRCWYLALRNKGRGLTAMNRSFRCLLHLNFLDILVVILEFNLKRRQAIKVLTPGFHSLFKRISRKHLPTSCNMLSTPYHLDNRLHNFQCIWFIHNPLPMFCCALCHLLSPLA